MNKSEQFKEELKALLLKYNASIDFSVGEGSDTYGLYDESITLSIEDTEVYSISGYGISAYDL